MNLVELAMKYQDANKRVLMLSMINIPSDPRENAEHLIAYLEAKRDRDQAKEKLDDAIASRTIAGSTT